MRSDSPPLGTLRSTRWRRGLAEHRQNGETEYVGAPPESEALEELADLLNYLMLMREGWSADQHVTRAVAADRIVREITEIYKLMAYWAAADGVDMSGLWSAESENAED